MKIYGDHDTSTFTPFRFTFKVETTADADKLHDLFFRASLYPPPDSEDHRFALMVLEKLDALTRG